MNVVLDTSAAIAVVLNEPHKLALVNRTMDAELLAPISLPIEIGNAFSAMLKRGRLSLNQANLAYVMFLKIPVQLREIDMVGSLKLAKTLGIYAYDAYMLDCAIRHRCELLTLDEGLKKAAARANVTVLEVTL